MHSTLHCEYSLVDTTFWPLFYSLHFLICLFMSAHVGLFVWAVLLTPTNIPFLVGEGVERAHLAFG